MKFSELDWEESLMKILIATFAILMLWIGFVIIPKQIEREDRAKQLANGCVYLGHAKEMNTVFFYDCDGNVIMKRVK